jgi:uncharacterized membrane protein
VECQSIDSRFRTSVGDDLWAFPLYILLILIIGIGVFLRVTRLDESLWLDELHSAWVVSESWGDIVPRAAQGNQPPLYFWLVRLVCDTYGVSEPALRAVSCVSGIGLLPATFLLVGGWSRSRLAGLTAIAAMAIDTNLLFFAREARA